MPVGLLFKIRFSKVSTIHCSVCTTPRENESIGRQILVSTWKSPWPEHSARRQDYWCSTFLHEQKCFVTLWPQTEQTAFLMEGLIQQLTWQDFLLHEDRQRIPVTAIGPPNFITFIYCFPSLRKHTVMARLLHALLLMESPPGLFLGTLGKAMSVFAGFHTSSVGRIFLMIEVVNTMPHRVWVVQNIYYYCLLVKYHYNLIVYLLIQLIPWVCMHKWTLYVQWQRTSWKEVTKSSFEKFSNDWTIGPVIGSAHIHHFL